MIQRKKNQSLSVLAFYIKPALKMIIMDFTIISLIFVSATLARYSNKDVNIIIHEKLCQAIVMRRKIR